MRRAAVVRKRGTRNRYRAKAAKTAANKRRRHLLRLRIGGCFCSALAGSAIALFVVWNVGLIFQWGTHLVPARGKISWSEMVHNQLLVVPLRMTHSLQTYFLHRKDMMQQIEQEDIEQQRARGAPEDRLN